MADYWQLEENTDQWQLEENTDLWLLEGGGPLNVSPAALTNPVRRPKQSGHVQVLANLLLSTLAVTAVNVPREPIQTPRPKATQPQQPHYRANQSLTTLLPAQPRQTLLWVNQPRVNKPQVIEYRNLNQTTLAPVAQAPFQPAPFTAMPPRSTAQQPQYLANLTTTTFYVPDTNLARTAIHTPRRQAPPRQQPSYVNLPPASEVAPIIPALFQRVPDRLWPKQPDYTANLTTSTFYVPDVNLAREVAFTPRFVRSVRNQPTYVNLPPGEAAPQPPDYYFLNDSGFTGVPTRRAPQQPALNTLPLLTFVAPAPPPKSQDVLQLAPRIAPRQQEPPRNTLPLLTAPSAAQPPQSQDLSQPRVLARLRVQNTIVNAPVAPDPQALPPKSQDLTARFVKQQRQQPTYSNQPPEQTPDYYFSNDTGFAVTWRVFPRQISYPNLSVGTLFDPGTPAKFHDWQLPVRARYVNRFDQQNGVLQLLTFVEPTLPPTSLDLAPIPVRALKAPQDTNQGQNPEFIPPPVPVVPPPSGGGGHDEDDHSHLLFRDYEELRKRRKRDLEQIREREQHAKAIPDETDKQIAKLLIEQDERDAKRAELALMQELADRYLQQQMAERLAAAVQLAAEQRDLAAIEQMQMAIELAMQDEEEALIAHLQAFLLLDDD